MDLQPTNNVQQVKVPYPECTVDKVHDHIEDAEDQQNCTTCFDVYMLATLQ